MRVGRRRLSREIALRVLFQYDAGEDLSPEECISLFSGCFDPGEDEERVLGCDEGDFKEALPFARELFTGVTSRIKELDLVLEEASENWRLDRMSRVDRNVMRLALYEMLYRGEIPHKVSLNEAIDLGKKYGAEDSGGFINGVLDRVHRRLAGETPSGAEEGPGERD